MNERLYDRGKELELALIKSDRSSWPLVEVVDKAGNKRKVRVNPEKESKLKQAQARKLIQATSAKTQAISDNELASRAAVGDPKAQAELYSKYKSDAKKIINTFVRDNDIADDLVADTFVKVFDKIDSYTAIAKDVPFKTWFTRVASNTARDYLRSAQSAFTKNALSEEQKKTRFRSIADSKTPQQALEAKQMADILKDAIESLPKEYSSTIKDFYFGGLSIKEIAEKDKVSESGVKQRLARAKDALRVKVSPDLYKAITLQFMAIEAIEPLD